MLKKLFETSCQRFDDQACKLLLGRSKISQTNLSGWNSPPPPPRTTYQPLFCERNLIRVLGHLLLQIHIYLSHIIYFPNSSFRLLAQTTLRNILGTKNLHEILSDRESISGSMQVRTLHASTSFGKIQSSGWPVAHGALSILHILDNNLRLRYAHKQFSPAYVFSIGTKKYEYIQENLPFVKHNVKSRLPLMFNLP